MICDIVTLPTLEVYDSLAVSITLDKSDEKGGL